MSVQAANRSGSLGYKGNTGCLLKRSMNNSLRLVLDLLRSSWLPKVALASFLICLAITVSVAVTQNIFDWIGESPPRGIDSVDVWKLGMVTGTAGSATAFLVTLYVAERNYRRGREHIPSLSLALRLQRVAASKSYDAVVATLEARNSGTGLCSFNEIHWEVAVLSPYDDNDVNELRQEYDERPDDEKDGELPWHTVYDEATKSSVGIEPNEVEQITRDFIIPYEITALAVSAWIVNDSAPKIAEGWYSRTVLIKEEALNT